MSDTITDVKLIHADNLQPDQLMIGDLIKTGDDIVEILFIESDSTGDNYDIQTENEFGEKEIVQYAYTDSIALYVFIDEEEQQKYFYALPRIKNATSRSGVSVDNSCDLYHKSLTGQTMRHADHLSDPRGRLSV